MYCYSSLKVVRGSIPFFKQEVMVVEGGLEKILRLKQRTQFIVLLFSLNSEKLALQ